MQTNVKQMNSTHPDWTPSSGCAHGAEAQPQLMTRVWALLWLVVWGRSSCLAFCGKHIHSALLSSGWSWCWAVASKGWEATDIGVFESWMATLILIVIWLQVVHCLLPYHCISYCWHPPVHIEAVILWTHSWKNKYIMTKTIETKLSHLL